MVNPDFLKQFNNIPFDTATLSESLSDYKSPKDKISLLEQSDIEMLKANVKPFLKNSEQLEIWSTDYFTQLVDLMLFP